jgi:glycosyltransferase involved in cell wall biosynthesis
VITSGKPDVSIVILNWNSPEFIDVCLHTLAITEGVEYEVVVVDNGSTDPASLPALRQFKEEGLITTLVEHPVNSFFSEGNNIGVRNTDPRSDYVLTLNSDVGFLRPDWLTQMLRWMDGTINYWPSVWGLQPASPSAGPRDIVSLGWSHDDKLYNHVRPEGWCVLWRRLAWRDFDVKHPFHNGFEHAVAQSIRDGNKCGVLFNYSTYLIHREQGSGKIPDGAFSHPEQPDMAGWFEGLTVESLDFSLGAVCTCQGGRTEHSSYICW